MPEHGPENPIQPPSEQRPKQEREIDVEKIMEKVCNIDANGTAFTFINMGDEEFTPEDDTTVLEAILRDGLLGLSQEPEHEVERRDAPPNVIKQQWVDNVRKRDKDYLVHFNIVGRMSDLEPEDGRPEIQRIPRVGSMRESQEWVIARKPLSKPGNRMALLIDISSYTEGPFVTAKPFWGPGTYINDPQHKTFYSSGYEDHKKNLQRNSHGEIVPRAGFGFAIGPRIPPRELKGVIIRPYKFKDAFEKNRHEVKDFRGKSDIHVEDSSSPDVVKEWVKMIEDKELRVYGDKRERLIPVYDWNGNLLWPKQMSYEEVKKFVAEREAKKKSET